MPSSKRRKTSAIGRSLLVLVAVSVFAPAATAAPQPSCQADALAAARKVRAAFERGHGVRVDKVVFEDVANEIASETCSQVAASASKRRVVAASSDATRRYLENALASGQSTATQALVADALSGRKGMGRMDRRSFGILKVECADYPGGMVAIGDLEIAQCGRRILLPSGDSQVSVSNKGARVCSGQVSLAVQQEKSCSCGGATPPAGAPALQPITCS
ncbi:MAG: hypothetical protein E6R08_08690 [Nevskiaceae bacterium]|nr:MAG: hypothetical protein E6R08_08690 [Nevskiaceae bacterium]